MSGDPLELLVEAVLAGDAEAYTGLVEQTLDELRCFVAMRTGDADTIDEVVQITYSDAFRNLRRYTPGGSVVAWLKGIARHRIQRAQRERRRGGQVEDSVWSRLVERHQDPEPVDADGLAAALRDCLAGLSPAALGLVEAYYQEGLGLAGLAESTGRSRASLAVSLCRARAALRECLQRKGVTAP